MRKTWIMLLAGVAMAGLMACSRTESGGTAAARSEAAEATTVADSTDGQAESEEGTGEVVGMTAIAHMDVYHQIETLIVEYSRNVVAPGIDGFTVEDFAVANFKEEYDQRPSTSAPITAVYTNDQPEVRADQTSVEGPYIIIEIEPTSYCVEEDGIYKPNHNAGVCTWRLQGEKCEWFRDDFSDYVVTQTVDVLDEAGNIVVEASKMPILTPDDVYTPDFEQFENLIIEDFDGKGNTIYYTLYVPEDYDPSKSYPLVFNSTGNGGRMCYTQQNEAGEFVNQGAVIGRDAVAVTVAEYKEDAIVASIQTWREQPDEWEYSDLEAALYLVDYLKENYSVDENRIYAIGSSYGTMLVSRMLNKVPGLFAAYIQCNGTWVDSETESKWVSVYDVADPESNHAEIFEGYSAAEAAEAMKEKQMDDISGAKATMKAIAETKMPVWVWHAVNDETIGFMNGVSTYEALTELYEEQGLTRTEISQLAKLRVFEDDEYWSAGIAERHQCSKMLAVYPEGIKWLFRQSK